ncbi:MAG: hypothetical protein ABJB66_06850 [Gemmatimonadaceae bacterium]
MNEQSSPDGKKTVEVQSDPKLPQSFDEVFAAELQQIEARRKAFRQLEEYPDRRVHLSGLALSGGGIRSATFCLGFLQGFQEALESFDYLSTVSGGGFTGGWWTAWLNREARGNSIFPPHEKIAPGREGALRGMNGAQPSGRNEPTTEGSLSAGNDPVHHIRLFSNYLTPRKSALGSDMWRAVNVIGRNMVLTWVMLVPLLLMFVAVAQLYFLATPATTNLMDATLMDRLVVLSRPLIACVTLLVILTALWLIASTSTLGSLIMTCAGLIFTGWSAYLLWSLRAPSNSPSWLTPDWLLAIAIASVILALVALLALFVAPRASSEKRLSPGVREWWRNRIAKWQSTILLFTVISTLILLVAGFGHGVIAETVAQATNKVKAAGGWFATLVAIASAIFTAFKSAPTGGEDAAKPNSSGAQIGLVLAPLIISVVLFIYLAYAGAAVVEFIARNIEQLNHAVAFAAVLCGIFVLYEYFSSPGIGDSIWKRAVSWKRIIGLAIWAVAAIPILIFPGALPKLHAGLFFAYLCGSWVIALGWMIDPNLTSMHNFYKARLTRAYLGASNTLRTNEEISEPHANDDIAFKNINSNKSNGPFHLVNATLNLTASNQLTSTQRTGASFTISSKHCGSVRTGFRPTADYMNGGMTLGTAVAISGAAASPVMGLQSPSAALTLLMALLNVRLGFWAATPSKDRWMSARPRLWWFYLLREAFAQTSQFGLYCYLTDGGHFDNTAAYSLVQRGCRKIVIVDCGADPGYRLDDIGTFVRLIREDFNAEVRMITPISYLKKGGAEGNYVEAEITYSADHLDSLGWQPDDRELYRKGKIYWVKPMVTADVPVDILNYDRGNAEFPQQSTADQWFDEAQFESYRCLGERSGSALLDLFLKEEA